MSSKAERKQLNGALQQAIKKHHRFKATYGTNFRYESLLLTVCRYSGFNLLYHRFYRYPIPANLLPKFQENNTGRLKDVKTSAGLEHLWLDHTNLINENGGSTYIMELYSNEPTKIKNAIGTFLADRRPDW